MQKAGITSIGAYIPYYYISRQTIGKAWDSRGSKGNRSIINFDEDSVTLAQEAAEECFRFVKRESTDALFFASTTAPYAEKSHSGLVATACDLKSGVFTADFAQCTRAAASALKLALDSCSAGSFRQALVTAADCRNAYPKTAQEQLFGDAAAAVTVGTEGIIASVDAFATTTNEITDIWRNAGESYIHLAEGRFATNHGYMDQMQRAVRSVLAKAGLEISAVDRLVFTSSSARDHLTLAKKLGADASRLQDTLLGELGYCGTAQPLLLLAAALESASPGEKILLAAYGNGADAFILTVTDEVKRVQQGGIQRLLERRGEVTAYTQFLSYRGLLAADPGQPYGIKSSTAAEWREQDTFIRLYGSRCKKCGASAFPVQRVCHSCGSVDEYESFRAPDRTVRIFTYSLDNYAGRSDFPLVGQIVAEDETGARYYLNTTDFKREDIEIGATLEFCFRRVHTLGGFVNYYWKLRPIRRGEGDRGNG